MKKKNLDQETLEWLITQVEAVKFGTVLITIHDGQIVQIDRTEKSRKEVAPAIKANRPKS